MLQSGKYIALFNESNKFHHHLPSQAKRRNMAQDSVEQLLGRLITDDVFRDALIRDFDRICNLAGFNLTDSERALLKKADFKAFSQLSETIDTGLQRIGMYCSGFSEQ